MESKEWRLVRKAVFLPIAMEVLERDWRLLDEVPVKMKRVYEAFFARVQNNTLQEMAAVKQQIRRSGIRIKSCRRSRQGIDAYFVCRGYHHELFLLWSQVRTLIEEEMLQGFVGCEEESYEACFQVRDRT